MSTLLKIGEDMQALASLLDEVAAEHGGEIGPEADGQLTAWFAELNTNLNSKADGYAAIIRDQELLAAVAKEESERMAKLASSRTNLAKSLKERMKLFMEAQGMKKVETDRFRLTVSGNGGLQPLEVDLPAEKLPAEFQKITVAADTDAIRSALKEGEVLEFARTLPRGTHLRIA